MTVAPLESKTITLKSKLENIARVEELINVIFEDYDLSPDYYGNMLVALTEAANNAICHGNKMDEGLDFEISFSHKGDDFIFVVTDQGSGFDYNNLPDPTSPENLEKPDGRGIFLMKNLANDVVFHNDGAKVELIFKAY